MNEPSPLTRFLDLVDNIAASLIGMGEERAVVDLLMRQLQGAVGAMVSEQATRYEEQRYENDKLVDTIRHQQRLIERLYEEQEKDD